MKKVKAPPREDLMKAIVVVADGSRLQFVKYHRIPVKVPARLKLFVDFIMKKYPGARHVNYYGGVSGVFFRQDKLQVNNETR